MSEPNHPNVVRRHLADFERRFTRVDGGVAYQPRPGGKGVLLPDGAAASLIAGMRAGIAEADAAHPWGWHRIWPAFFAAPMLLILFGLIVDLPGLASALMVPVWLGMLALGPGLGAWRIHVAWRRGVAAADAAAQAAGGDEVTLPSNPLQAPFLIAALFGGAVIGGLFVASWGAPEHVRVRIDALLAVLIGPVVLLVVALGLGAAAIDLWRRRRVSEAEIADAMAERRRRPLQ